MVQRLIQTLKRRIAVMEHDPLWSSGDLATIVAKIMESIRLIPNATTKIKPFIAHFGRPPNTELSNMITKPSNKNLSYKQINKYASDQSMLRHDTQHSPWKSCRTGTTIANQNSTSSIKSNRNRTPSQVIRTIQRTRRCLATSALLVRSYLTG